jgi:hypothetical protein
MLDGFVPEARAALRQVVTFLDHPDGVVAEPPTEGVRA